MRRTLAVSVAAARLAVGAAGAQPAAAEVYFHTMDEAAVLADDGSEVSVTGPIGCDAGDHFALRLVVSQRSTGGVAWGPTRAVCEPNGQQWEASLSTRGLTPLEPGEAVACGRIVTGDGEAPTDARQWCQDILLAPVLP
ncbi:MAG: hypothetical protein IT307_18780 [Chloroflexi bacterium]|nr:hypothetical protein [Chloroflexota bacterium]